MVKFAVVTVAAATLMAGLGTQASAQSRLSRDPSYALGQMIAATAASAEHTAPGPDAVQPAVRLAVETAIIGAAAEPPVVLAALDSALAACRPVYGKSSSPDWTCPSSPGAFLALNSLRVVVVAQLETTDPAALRIPGSSSAFGSLMTTAPSANYTHF